MKTKLTETTESGYRPNIGDVFRITNSTLGADCEFFAIREKTGTESWVGLAVNLNTYRIINFYSAEVLSYNYKFAKVGEICCGI